MSVLQLNGEEKLNKLIKENPLDEELVADLTQQYKKLFSSPEMAEGIRMFPGTNGRIL